MAKTNKKTSAVSISKFIVSGNRCIQLVDHADS